MVQNITNTILIGLKKHFSRLDEKRLTGSFPKCHQSSILN